jgi:hypothetical protein
MLIQPSVGRVVWYYPGPSDPLYMPGYAEPRAAIVARVWNDRMVNLSVASTEGVMASRTSRGSRNGSAGARRTTRSRGSSRAGVTRASTQRTASVRQRES